MLARIADKLILQPSRDPIDPEGRRREWIEADNRKIEAWKIRSREGDDAKVDLLAIKFPGTGGRAERGGPHPFETWPDLLTEVWTINHAGYGGSDGVASMQNLSATCNSVWDFVAAKNPGVPIVLVGNSLGCVSALYLAARRDAAGLFLRNPVPIHQMIRNRPRYNWWNFGLAKLIANQVPAELDAIANAQSSKCPAFFVRSEHDRVVPPEYQLQIMKNYLGDTAEFVLESADHHHSVPESQIDSYLEVVKSLQGRWLG